MPERSQLILDLQALDLEIGRLTRQIQQIDAQLGDQMKVRAAEHATKQAEQAQQARDRAQREAEMDLSAIEHRIREHEQQLYSGRGGPRELEALQRDIEHDRQRRAEAENQALAAMEAAEQARAEVDRIKKAVARVLGDLSTDQQRLAGDRERAQGQLAAKQAERSEVAAKLSPQSLALYDRLRQRMPDGIAAAEVTQNRCEGCRTTLPSAEIQHARNSDALSQCSACGRIIHVPLG